MLVWENQLDAAVGEFWKTAKNDGKSGSDQLRFSVCNVLLLNAKKSAYTLCNDDSG